MELLLDPNLVYLLLVFAILMAVLAILSPGTGIFELGGLFGFLFVGYFVFTRPEAVNFWAFGLLILGGVAFLLALRDIYRRITLGTAIICIMLGTAFLIRREGLEPAVSPFLALIVSGLAGGFLWVIANKSLEARMVQPSHDLGRLIGAVGEAKTDIRDEGTVQVMGELWTARSKREIRAGDAVRVIGREGFVLEVEPDQA